MLLELLPGLRLVSRTPTAASVDRGACMTASAAARLFRLKPAARAAAHFVRTRQRDPLGAFARLSIEQALAAIAERNETQRIAAADASQDLSTPPSVVALGDRIDRHRQLVRKLYRMQEAWRPFTITQRLIECGRVRVDNCVDLERIGTRGGSASVQFRGLKTCRTKACAVCYQRRKAQHHAEADGVIKEWRRTRGTDPLFATLTIKHAWSDSLDVTGRGIRECFRLLQQDRRWRRTRDRFGIEYLCALEITHGSAGFHPHLHVCLLPKIGISRRELTRMRRRLFKVWSRIVVREKKRVPGLKGEAFRPDAKGYDLRKAKNPAEYMTKLGLELTDPTLDKAGRLGGRTMMQVLGDLALQGADRDRAIFAEYERDTRKQRDLTYSGGLRELRAAIAAHVETERKALDRDLVCRLPYEVWDRIQHRRREIADDAWQAAALYGREYVELLEGNASICEALAATRDHARANGDPETASVAASDLERLLSRLAEARRLWLAARARALHDPRAELREHAAVNLDAVCRLLDEWFPGTDTTDRVRDWTAEEIGRRAQERAPIDAANVAR